MGRNDDDAEIERLRRLNRQWAQNGSQHVQWNRQRPRKRARPPKRGGCRLLALLLLAAVGGTLYTVAHGVVAVVHHLAAL